MNTLITYHHKKKASFPTILDFFYTFLKEQSTEVDVVSGKYIYIFFLMLPLKSPMLIFVTLAILLIHITYKCGHSNLLNTVNF